MAENVLLTILVLLVCVALSFLFSGMETGVMALNRLRIRQLMRAGDPRASVLQGYLDNPENFLWTILVGNTIANFAIFSLGSFELHSLLHGRPVWWGISFAAGVFAFYTVCELLPKTLFQRFPNRLTLALARPFRFIHMALAPLVAIVAWFSRGLLRWTHGQTFTGRLFGNREELRFVMQESGAELTTDEKTMINRVFDLQTVRVSQLAVAWPKVITVPASASISEALSLFRKHNLTRLPVLHAQTQRVAGVINLEQIIYLSHLDQNSSVEKYMQPALFLHDHLRVEDALHRLQRSGARMAIVVGRNHHEIGVITMHDILKTIFGEVSL